MKFDENYTLLEDMVEDSYYPAFLVEKVKKLILPVISLLEDGEKDKEIIQREFDEMVRSINNLKKEFEENNSQLETVARDSLAVTARYILEWFDIEIDMEDAVREIFF